ncbi:hypothetical protein BASA50_004002 [Batrachochytrium salamandrivorans]|uniref:Uncharacterized protein n=1 Tax=Batrachochytrium salamandrivorans TaxID=1357716 RepID=A0ABQ8FJU8_9FUNG|nr:hypothetical protein BASA50_004002 [Batrachochytrium salamandrivorans]
MKFNALVVAAMVITSVNAGLEDGTNDSTDKGSNKVKSFFEKSGTIAKGWWDAPAHPIPDQWKLSSGSGNPGASSTSDDKGASGGPNTSGGPENQDGTYDQDSFDDDDDEEEGDQGDEFKFDDEEDDPSASNDQGDQGDQDASGDQDDPNDSNTSNDQGASGDQGALGGSENQDDSDDQGASGALGGPENQDGSDDSNAQGGPSDQIVSDDSDDSDDPDYSLNAKDILCNPLTKDAFKLQLNIIDHAQGFEIQMNDLNTLDNGVSNFSPEEQQAYPILRSEITTKLEALRDGYIHLMGRYLATVNALEVIGCFTKSLRKDLPRNLMTLKIFSNTGLILFETKTHGDDLAAIGVQEHDLSDLGAPGWQ